MLLSRKNFRSLLKIRKGGRQKKELHHFQEMQISDDESKKSESSFTESVETGEISYSSSEWKTGSDKLYVTCLNRDSKNLIGKPIKNYLDLFVNTSLNHVSIRSRLISQPNNKLFSNCEQSINATDLSPITFGVILPPKLHGKMSTISQICPGESNENQNSKVRTIKYY